jgi:hypothetical protein
MFTTDRPRLSEASLTPKAFGGSAAEIDNAERWLRYLNQYVQYRNLRDDEALTLFKLLLTDQAQDWLYALPDDQADSFHRLQEAFMSRYTPNPLQRYQKASHMWSRMQQDNESVDSYFTAIKSAANQIKLRDEQQLCFCLIRGLKPQSSTTCTAEQPRHLGRHPAQCEGRGDRQRRNRRQRQGRLRTVKNCYAASGQADGESDRHAPASHPRRPRRRGSNFRPRRK